MNPYEIIGYAAIAAAIVLALGGYIAMQYEPVCVSDTVMAEYRDSSGEHIASAPIQTQRCTHARKGSRP